MNGIYQIKNLGTSAYAGLLNDDDRSPVVNLTLGVDTNKNRGRAFSILKDISNEPKRTWTPAIQSIPVSITIMLKHRHG